MQTVAQVNTMADFIRLVGAARDRNSGLVKNPGQTPDARSFQNIMRPDAGYAHTKTRQTSMYDVPSADAVSIKQQGPKQILGTKFDAYA